MKATPIMNLILAAMALGSAQVASASPAKAPSIRARGSSTTIEVTAAKKATLDRPFTVQVKASNTRGIKHLWITFQDRIFSHDARGKKNLALTWKVSASEAGRHPIEVVAENKMGDKTTKKQIVTVTASKKRPKGPTHLTAKPPACAKGVEGAMDHCAAKAGANTRKYNKCLRSTFSKRCLLKTKKIAAKKGGKGKKGGKAKPGATSLAAKRKPRFPASKLLDSIPQYITDRPPACKETTETWGNETEGGITHTDCEGCFYEETWTATELTTTVGCCDKIDEQTWDCVSTSETGPRPPS